MTVLGVHAGRRSGTVVVTLALGLTVAGAAVAQSDATRLLDLAGAGQGVIAEPVRMAAARRPANGTPLAELEPVNARSAAPAADLLRMAAGGEPLAEPVEARRPFSPSSQLSAVYASASRSARAALAGAPSPPAIAPRETEPAAEAAQTAPSIEAESGDRPPAAGRPSHHALATASASAIADPTSAFRGATSGLARFAPSDGVDAVGSGLTGANRLLGNVRGLRIGAVSFFGGYSSSALPPARLGFAPSMGGIGSDADYGGSATLSYQREARRWSTGFVYTPSRTQRARWTEWNTTDHNIRGNFSRQLGRRMSVGAAARASNTGIEQFAFRLPQFHTVENPPLDFDDLTERVESGEFTDEEFASALTGAPVIDDPGGRVLGVGRAIGLGGSTSLNYQTSAASRFRFSADFQSVTMDRMPQAFAGNQQAATFVQNIDQRGVGLGYHRRLGPGLTADVRARTTIFESNFGGTQSHSFGGSVSKRLSRHWSASGDLGLAYVRLTSVNPAIFRSADALGASMQPTGGGSLGYRSQEHSLSGTFARSAGNAAGLAARKTDSYAVRWSWQPLRSTVGYYASASRQISGIAGASVADQGRFNLETTMVSAGVNHRIGPTALLQTGYYWGTFRSPFRGLLSGLSIHRVQSTITWRPTTEGR